MAGVGESRFGSLMLTCPSFTRLHSRWCPTTAVALQRREDVGDAADIDALIHPPAWSRRCQPPAGHPQDWSPGGRAAARPADPPQPQGDSPTASPSSTGNPPTIDSSNVVEQIAEKQAAARQLVVVPTRIDGRDGRGLVLATQSPCSTTTRSKQLTTLPPVPTSDPCQVSVRSFAPLARAQELSTCPAH